MAELAGKYPQLLSLRGDAGNGIHARIDVSELGFQAMVFDPDGTWLVQPNELGGGNDYVSFGLGMGGLTLNFDEQWVLIFKRVGDKVHLRVELQTLFRLPRSNAILFGIRAYLISMAEIARVPKWRRRFHRVLRDLDPALIEYKGLGRYREMTVAYLAQFDDGEPTSLGPQSDIIAL